MKRNKYYLLNFVFLICLIILFLNDHFLKFKFSNWLTGKLSDATGIIILPLLLAFLIPKLKEYSIVVAAILFIFWKSPFSQDLIDLYNEYSFNTTSRIIDYTDLYVLVLLPIPYFIIRKIDNPKFIRVDNVNPFLVLLPTIFTLMATEQMPYAHYKWNRGELILYNCHITIDGNQHDIVEKLRTHHIIFDSIFPMGGEILALRDTNFNNYRLNRLIIETDTLRSLDLSMCTTKNKTRIYFEGMQISENINTKRLFTRLRRYYYNILFKDLKRSLKE